MLEVSPGLRRWFVIHFAVDWLVGVPLLLFPTPLLQVFGWGTVDPVATRLFAAALLGIGGQSLLGRNGGVAEFRAMLNLKLIWSGAAAAGLALSIAQGAPWLAWVALVIFVGFYGLWAHYRRAIR